MRELRRRHGTVAYCTGCAEPYYFDEEALVFICPACVRRKTEATEQWLTSIKALTSGALTVNGLGAKDARREELVEGGEFEQSVLALYNDLSLFANTSDLAAILATIPAEGLRRKVALRVSQTSDQLQELGRQLQDRETAAVEVHNGVGYRSAGDYRLLQEGLATRSSSLLSLSTDLLHMVVSEMSSCPRHDFDAALPPHCLEDLKQVLEAARDLNSLSEKHSVRTFARDWPWDVVGRASPGSRPSSHSQEDWARRTTDYRASLASTADVEELVTFHTLNSRALGAKVSAVVELALREIQAIPELPPMEVRRGRITHSRQLQKALRHSAPQASLQVWKRIQQRGSILQQLAFDLSNLAITEAAGLRCPE